MPQAEGGYVSLSNETANVYNSTTEPTKTKTVLESVKKAIEHAVGKHEAPLLNSNDSKITIQAMSNARDQKEIKTISKTTSVRMPSAPTHTHNAESTRLLGTMPAELDDIELRSVQLQQSHSRDSISNSCDIRRIATDKGDITVAIQGDVTKPAILTMHDLGLNYASTFTGFFNYPTMRALLENFCVYHVTAPGQEENAPTFPENFVYPTMDELASQLLFVLSHFGLKSVIGFGVGCGANILVRFALQYPDKVGALCLVNCSSTQAGWIEWGYQSMNARNLRSKGMTQGVLDYLMWHHFGRNPEERNLDLVQMYKSYFERSVNPVNLALFIDSYIKRTDMNIARTPTGSPQANASTLKMPVLNITGSLSPHIDDTVTFNGRLEPTKTNWMKISDCGLVLEEQPGKLAEAFRLFLQGEGYAPSFMSQHYLKYHFKSFICTINNNEVNGNNGNDIEIDVLNGNSNGRKFNYSDRATATNATALASTQATTQIRITENPLPESIVN